MCHSWVTPKCSHRVLTHTSFKKQQQTSFQELRPPSERRRTASITHPLKGIAISFWVRKTRNNVLTLEVTIMFTWLKTWTENNLRASMYPFLWFQASKSRSILWYDMWYCLRDLTSCRWTCCSSTTPWRISLLTAGQWFQKHPHSCSVRCQKKLLDPLLACESYLFKHCITDFQSS